MSVEMEITHRVHVDVRRMGMGWGRVVWGVFFALCVNNEIVLGK